MDLSPDQWYALCEDHKPVKDKVGGVIKEHRGSERCDFMNKKKRCRNSAAWEWFGGSELVD